MESFSKIYILNGIFLTKAADEGFESLGISSGAAEIIKSRMERTNQPEEIFLKYFEQL